MVHFRARAFNLAAVEIYHILLNNGSCIHLLRLRTDILYCLINVKCSVLCAL